MPVRRITILLALAAAVLAAPAPAGANPDGPDWYVDAGADWTQAYIKEADGTELHADVMRPKGLPADAKTPVIVSVGPYFNHSGQTDPSGITDDPGPSRRFQDFVVGAHLMQRGYTWVMVDLRGFGASTGCLDWAGPGEQADVKSAVEWAATQKWSTGAVGLYGKSYDAVTGLIGEAVQPAGLKAIVAQEPVYDDYNYLYTNGVRFVNSLATPALYDSQAVQPGVLTDDSHYQTNALVDGSPACEAQNSANQSSDNNHDSAFWKARNLIAASKGHAIPLLLTQGFLEDNTKPDGAWEYFNELTGPKRGWFGMWDHIRGNDRAEGDNTYPRWFDEVMRWYDHFLRDVPLADAPVDKDPVVEVETSDGSWRAESAFPPTDSDDYATKLLPGTYTDTGTNDGTPANGNPGDTTGVGVWTFSPPLAHEAHLSGVPHITLDVSPAVPQSSLSADLYDVSADGTALLLSRTAYLLPGAGTITAEMYGNDWLVPAGHRLGVLVTTANAEWWTPNGTQAPVTVNGGQITLPFLRHTRTATIPGKTPARLAAWLKSAPFTLPAGTVAEPTTAAGFALPPAQTEAPGPAPVQNPSVPATPAAPRLTARLAGRKRKLVVYGNAPVGARVVVRLVRGRRAVATKRVKARFGAYRVTVRAKRPGRYRALVRATAGGARLKASTKPRRVR